MKSKFPSAYLLLFFILVFSNLKAQDIEIEYPFQEPGTSVSRGVFGKDDRKEVKDAAGYQDFVRATAAMISKDNIYNNEFYAWSLREKLTREFGVNKFDKNVKFLDQPTVASCTGFLIGPDILVTAGHCINSLEEAKNYVWVFDYTSESKFINGRKLNFKEENIYETVEIIASVYDDSTDDDYAILRLNRPSERAPYRFRTSGSVLNNSNVNTIGAPTGLPLKFATNAVVVDNSPKNWFKSDIDSFPGNSGGPVFDQNGFIEGILVRGAVEYSEGYYTGDYKYDSECDCIKTVQWDSVRYTAGCQSQKINTIPLNAMFTIIYENLSYAIENNLEDRFKSWSIYNWIFNHDYTNNNGPLEITAINNNNINALSSILKFTGKSMTDNQAKSLLDLSVKLQNDIALTTLLENDIFPDAGMDSDYSALQLAVLSKNNSAANILISYGADPKIIASNGDNLLHLAAKSGNDNFIKTLLDLGIDAGAKNNRNQFPEKIAQNARNKSLAKTLKNARRGR